MTIEEFRITITSMLENGDIDSAFRKAWEHLIPLRDVTEDFVILKGNWEDAKRDKLRQSINDAEMRIIRTQIRSAILNRLKNVLDADFEAKRSPEKVAALLVVLSPNLACEIEMNKFFPFEYFRQVDFVNEETWQQSIISSDLVIFDNYVHLGIQVKDEVRKSQLEKLRWLIDDTDRCVVWFGSFSEVVSQNPDRIYAANSRFALYARVREMLEFLKYKAAKDTEKQD